MTTEIYRLITTLGNPKEGTARELINLYHERWEIETSFRELKSTLLHGQVLRSKSVELIEQEIYAVLIVAQLLRTVMSEATNTIPGTDPDRASFTVALASAQDLLVLGPPPTSTRTSTGADNRNQQDGNRRQRPGWLALAGQIGEHVLVNLLPPRRFRVNSRTVKRAISKYQARNSKPHSPTLPATISIQLLEPGQWLTTTTTA